MVKIKDWDEFCVRGWDLASMDPINTRWVFKINLMKRLLLVKITNNLKCYMYTAKDPEAELNKIKQFGLTMTRILTKSEDEKKSRKKTRRRG